MRSMPILALVLTCSGPVAAADNLLEPDPRRCARVLPTLVDDDASLSREGGAADPVEPLLYKAVVHRVEGCAVLIMHGTGELRPVPEIKERRSLFMPAR